MSSGSNGNLVEEIGRRSVAFVLVRLRPRHADKGQTLVEYGLIVAFASLVVAVLLTTMGNQLINFFEKVTSTLASV